MRTAFAIAMMLIAPSALGAEMGGVQSWRICFSQRILEARSVPDERLLKRLEDDCRREQKKSCTLEFGLLASGPKARQMEQACLAEADK